MKQRKFIKRMISMILIMSLVLGGHSYRFTQKDAEVVQAATNSYGLRDNIQDGVILHCFNWKYNDIKAELPNIAKAGFTSVQTSPAQKGVNSGTWYWLYQPLGFYIGDNDLGTKAELKALCEEADKYGIKVVVDIVANHLAGDHTNIQADLKDSQYWHNYSNTIDYYNRYEITHGNLGMADINTEHEYVMQCVNNYIAELKSVGVDGLRWDAAKHIGLPSEGSNFWPTVCGNNGLWNYGEILGAPTSASGYDYLMTEYTNYMSVTDSSYGSTLRNAFNSGTVPTTHANWTNRAVATDKMVYWAETHDTWSNGPESGYSYDMSQNVIDRAYAIAASREGSSALYFSRPSKKVKDEIKAGVKGSTHFTSKEVAAVNHFHNAMVGQSEYFVSSGNVAAVCREKGVVVALGAGSGYVSFPNGGGTTKSGTYTDEITGNTWTVTETTISGTVGDTGIAVVYDCEYVEEEAVNTAYLALPSGWSEPIYCYVYNDSGATNAAWPGVQMTKDMATGYYKYAISDAIQNPKVIFYSSDTNRYPNDMEPGLSFDTYGKWIYINGVWKVYNEEQITTTVAETTTKYVEPPTQVEPTTKENNDLLEVFGMEVGNPSNGIISVVWGNPGNGQLFNVYVDGALAVSTTGEILSNVGCAYYTIPATEGTHTIKVTSTLDGKETAGMSMNIEVLGTSETESVTVPSSDLNGYVTAGANWTELPYWSVYFASGWGNNPTGSYRDGGSYDDFGVYVNSASLSAWGIQMKTQPIAVTNGKTYTCKVVAEFNTDMTDTITFKDENTQVAQNYTLVKGTNEFEITFVPNSGTAQIFLDLGMLPMGAGFKITSFSLVCENEETTIEETTAEETTTKEVTTEEETATVEIIDGGIEINGYQISSINKGMRTVYSVDETIDGKEVVASGIIYSLTDYADESDMYIGSTREYVKSYQSTTNGICPIVHSESDIATSYAMTMKFATTTAYEYNTKWLMRAYAKLSDGTYVYTKCVEYTIYEVADELYQGNMMYTQNAHKYLYTDILSVVNKDYVMKEFALSNTIVK